MSASSVFWNLFVQTGAIGPYLLYKYTDSEPDIALDAEDDRELGDIAFERG